MDSIVQMILDTKVYLLLLVPLAMIIYPIIKGKMRKGKEAKS